MAYVTLVVRRAGAVSAVTEPVMREKPAATVLRTAAIAGHPLPLLPPLAAAEVVDRVEEGPVEEVRVAVDPQAEVLEDRRRAPVVRPRAREDRRRAPTAAPAPITPSHAEPSAARREPFAMSILVSVPFQEPVTNASVGARNRVAVLSPVVARHRAAVPVLPQVNLSSVPPPPCSAEQSAARLAINAERRTFSRPSSLAITSSTSGCRRIFACLAPPPLPQAPTNVVIRTALPDHSRSAASTKAAAQSLSVAAKTMSAK